MANNNNNNKWFGKYRALVVNNKDPKKMGRVKVRCPSVLGEYVSAWCTPCVPCAFNDGGLFYVPSVNETVWVEFEEGDPTKPLWTGGWWIPNRTPMQSDNTVENKIMLISRNQHIIEVDDKNNTIIIKMKDGTRLKLGNGIEITAPNGRAIDIYGTVKMHNTLHVSGDIHEGGKKLVEKYQAR